MKIGIQLLKTQGFFCTSIHNGLMLKETKHLMDMVSQKTATHKLHHNHHLQNTYFGLNTALPLHQNFYLIKKISQWRNI